METNFISFARAMTVAAMIGFSVIILLGKRLDSQVHNGVFYGGMLVITLVIGGSLLLALFGY
jgi:uncharacterized membrane protein YjfL (UPF0719 family)